MFDRPSGGDRAILVNLDFGDMDFAESGEEIRRLAESAGVEPVAVIQGRRHRPDAATYAGAGKVQEIAQAVQSAGASLVLFNHDLSPAQERNLERDIACRVVDRSSHQSRPHLLVVVGAAAHVGHVVAVHDPEGGRLFRHRDAA